VAQALLQAGGKTDLAKKQMTDLSRAVSSNASCCARAAEASPYPNSGRSDAGWISQLCRVLPAKIEEVRRDMGCAVLMVSPMLRCVMARLDRVICA